MARPGYFAAFALFALLCGGLFALFLYTGMPQAKPEGLISSTLHFTSWDTKQMNRSASISLQLYAAEDQRPFALNFYEGYQEWIPNPQELCDGAAYQAEVLDCGDFWELCTITALDGTPVLTYENYQQGYQNSMRAARMILGAFSAFGFFFYLTGMCVAHCPNRFPRRMVRLYFKYP